MNKKMRPTFQIRRVCPLESEIMDALTAASDESTGVYLTCHYIAKMETKATVFRHAFFRKALDVDAVRFGYV